MSQTHAHVLDRIKGLIRIIVWGKGVGSRYHRGAGYLGPDGFYYHIHRAVDSHTHLARRRHIKDDGGGR